MLALRFFSACLCLLFCSVAYAQDYREFQHGVDFVHLASGQYKLIWSSSGNPPTGEDPQGNWTHDIYSSPIIPSNPQIVPATLISRPEAQEPASSAISSDGHIMITMEDGWNVQNTVGQRYGVYDSNLAPVDAYPNLVLDGGHSGHVTAVDNRFVVFYSNEWVDGGGVNNLGTGDDVLLKVYNSSGILERASAVVVGNATRDWWPLVSGSNDHAMLLWQRYVNGKTYSDLMFSIYDPATGNVVQTATQLTTNLQYYTYDVQYLPGVDRFLALGTYVDGGGFAYLIDDAGNIAAQNLALPGIVRESQPAVRMENGIARIVYPKESGGVAVLSVTGQEINLNGTVNGTHWYEMGSDGIFTDDLNTYFVNLSPIGIQEYTFPLTPLDLGDFNGDTDVDGMDFLKWQRGETPNPTSLADFTNWENGFGSGGGSFAAAIVIPEPTSFVLLAIGLAVVTMRAGR